MDTTTLIEELDHEAQPLDAAEAQAIEALEEGE
jgi:hypothetical protein